MSNRLLVALLVGAVLFAPRPAAANPLTRLRHAIVRAAVVTARTTEQVATDLGEAALELIGRIMCGAACQ